MIIFHPRHDLTLARLGQEDIIRIIDEWISVYTKRGSQEGIKYVQIFEVCALASYPSNASFNLRRKRTKVL